VKWDMPEAVGARRAIGLPAGGSRGRKAGGWQLLEPREPAGHIGRVNSSDVHRDRTTRLAGHLAAPPACSGFLLRSPVVTGWPHLGVEAYTQVQNSRSPPAGR
jgi:hypothetical protein